MTNVLFVYLGSIHLSPIADALFLDLLEKVNLRDKVEVDSAATRSWYSTRLNYP
ncbi:arsenate reductase/protein-tyrosine-phosphatase family protein [Viridibacillus soli]|uniref:arsenate reductase/protein-tyrosine-phosphatase family protein n=1 Tax=Viridibacillus soli TaxID=2798301 RepID=UPI002D808237|nr:hypothetical protein [Viridibacillus soli]